MTSIQRMEALLKDLDSLSVSDWPGSGGAGEDQASMMPKTVGELLSDTSALSGFLHFLPSSATHEKSDSLPWLRRFFVLSPSAIHAFASSSPSEGALDLFPLSASTKINAAPVLNTPLAFEVTDRARSWIFCAASKTSKNSWLDMIQIMLAKSSGRSSPVAIARNGSMGEIKYPVRYDSFQAGNPRLAQERSLQDQMMQMRDSRELDDQTYFRNMQEQRQYLHPMYPAVINTAAPPARQNSIAASFNSTTYDTVSSNGSYRDDSWHFTGNSPQSEFFSPISSTGSFRQSSVPSDSPAGIPGGGVFGSGSGAELERSDSKVSWGVATGAPTVDGITLKTVASSAESLKSDDSGSVAPKKKKTAKAQMAMAYCNF
ncbi:hypothetical protein BC830DRAFT_1138433 [Chytriomyces sp. MP71]|nr:hypothetical protein BC830DRAFT_1138433 [Chytriomyces sp. MP71]